ncbi:MULTISPECIES: flagellar basal body P-ring formation chaperone FlgA [unclassified Legionella]|uniref:flagellar basal body P-ring formation chaperone FlgA n=1 Tax=unclassified Legionella TaxID=2622702 RepID=UPI0010553961|nr:MULTISPECIES: flagellar basal body P-ring formation chaperone FlgA [unclassified Legionella]MDI9817562.1 flagellar basal body P-ring formation chaperone FlgA [Legionella sp. PL877]
MKSVINSLFLLFMSHLANAHQVVLSFQPSINQQAATLGDVIKISNDRHQWALLPLDSHPKAGESLSREHIIQWMISRIGPFNWQWQGKTRVKIKAKFLTAPQILVDKAKQALIQELNPKYLAVEVDAVTNPKGSEYPLASFHPHIRVQSPTAKRVCVWLINPQQTIPVWFKVKAYQRVLVAKAPLPYHSRVNNQGFLWKKRNIAGLHSEPDKRISGDKRLKTTLKPNDVLLAENLEPIPAVTKGQKIQVNVYSSGITIKTAAIALKDGYPGQAIRMKNPVSNKFFMARIVAEKQAEVRA